MAFLGLEMSENGIHRPGDVSDNGIHKSRYMDFARKMPREWCQRA